MPVVPTIMQSKLSQHVGLLETSDDAIGKIAALMIRTHRNNGDE